MPTSSTMDKDDAGTKGGEADTPKRRSSRNSAFSQESEGGSSPLGMQLSAAVLMRRRARARSSAEKSETTAADVVAASVNDRASGTLTVPTSNGVVSSSFETFSRQLSPTSPILKASEFPTDAQSNRSKDTLGQEGRALLGWFEGETHELRTYLSTIDMKLDVLIELTEGVRDDFAYTPHRFTRLGCIKNPVNPVKPILAEAFIGGVQDEEQLRQEIGHPAPPESTRKQSSQSSGLQRQVTGGSSCASKRPTDPSVGGQSKPDSRAFGSTSSNPSLLDTTFVLDKIKNNNRSQAQQVVWEFLEDASGGRWSRMYIRLTTLAVILSVILTLLETVALQADADQSTGFAIAELVFDSLYTAEILVRFAVCPNRWFFFANIYNIIDLGAGLLPFAIRCAVLLDGPLGWFGRDSMLHLFLFCYVPVLRTLKLLRHFEQFHLLLRAFKIAGEALPVLLFIQTIIVLLFASMIYAVEPRHNIPTFARALWLTIVTMMTIGYGDTVPVSSPGHIIVSVLIICSTLYMAMPLGIVGEAFSQVWADRDRLLLVKRTRDRFCQYGYTAEDVPRLFNLFDVSKTGELTLHEFSRMIHALKVILDNERILALFKTLDTDGGGSIDDEEFVRNIFPSAYMKIYGTSVADCHG